jgi:hypothetical protein
MPYIVETYDSKEHKWNYVSVFDNMIDAINDALDYIFQDIQARIVEEHKH